MNENKMGVQPVNRLLVSMSVPMMVSMLVQALYNVVDSIFVASLSEDALTAAPDKNSTFISKFLLRHRYQPFCHITPVNFYLFFL